MSRRGYYKTLYLIAAIYDWILGFGFLFFYKPLFEIFGIVIPNNPAFLSAATLFIGLLGFILFWIYRDLDNSRRLVQYAIMFKFSYISVVLFYFITRGSDFVETFFLVFVGFDMIFAILFIESLGYIKKG